MGCQSQTPKNPAAAAKIKIVASTPTYGQMAQAVGGKYAKVTTIMKQADANPHDFEPNVQQAKLASQAQIAVYNGLNYDSWMQKLLANNQEVKKLNVGRLLGQKTGANPHIWYQPQALSKAAQSLAQQLGQQKPKQRQYFRKQAQKYQAQVQPAQATLAKIKAQRTSKMVAVSEPVFDYSLKAMGYQIANPQFAEAIEAGNDPSPQQIAQLQAQIKQHQLTFFVWNRQASSKTIDNLVRQARKEGIPIVQVRETQPANQTYGQWLEETYQQVLKIEAKR
ncbi:zinc ABC transporter substrate-binding protein [Lactobacillus sp. DCY120]|uniref:Zinc ABC transporter substrate-binding protein n=1 Tax=Bombilactobacillus apium TaxID=2675299 RepID=A0A850RC83_9LACO|nr:zinc ABC transporter substrate-binding protein [Bombilactobacillus apium]NVY96398.1 zinc ABC transporter substrate-binding protein [Bombilactobacillus apium]